jgi:hypothetical protein
MTASSLVVSIRMAWWLRVYLNTLALLCRAFDAEPNWQRAGYWVSRGIRIEIKKEGD